MLEMRLWCLFTGGGAKEVLLIMDTNEVLEQLEPWIREHLRPSFKPITQEGDGDPGDSKFAGKPWLAAGEAWPVCGTCKRPLMLFLQLDLAALPQALPGKFGEGLLQLFYCTGDRVRACDAIDGWQPFSTTAKLTRIIQPEGEPQPVEMPQWHYPFPPKTIVGWEEMADHPHPQEHAQLGVTYEYDWENGKASVACAPLDLTFEDIEDDYLAEHISAAQAGDKLAGWPLWIQDVEYPHCPICHNRMELVFQLDSEDNLPFMFGDAGVGHITQCAEHKDMVAFGWACH